jgi:hypothetical protein
MPAYRRINIRLSPPDRKPKNAPAAVVQAPGQLLPGTGHLLIGRGCLELGDSGEPEETLMKRIRFGLGGSARYERFQQSSNEVHINLSAMVVVSGGWKGFGPYD